MRPTPSRETSTNTYVIHTYRLFIIYLYICIYLSIYQIQQKKSGFAPSTVRTPWSPMHYVCPCRVHVQVQCTMSYITYPTHTAQPIICHIYLFIGSASDHCQAVFKETLRSFFFIDRSAALRLFFLFIFFDVLMF